MSALPALVLMVAAACWLVPLLSASLAVRFGRVRVTNYRGAPLPLGLGWAWAAWGGVLLAASATSGEIARQFLPLGALVAGTALLGRLDDAFGSPADRGFRGHLTALAHGRVTTGLVKLVGIGALALWAGSVVPAASAKGLPGTLGWLLAALVIAGAANLLNLLDLRPGRTLKAYALLAVPSAALEVAGAGWNAGSLALGAVAVLAVAGPALACWRADLGERAMLGDMGANGAGALAGWLLASVLPLAGLAVAGAVLVALNLASERFSFSAAIERNGLLRRIDALGRVRHMGAEVRAESGETGS